MRGTPKSQAIASTSSTMSPAPIVEKNTVRQFVVSIGEP
jgi:hypothetical protein